MQNTNGTLAFAITIANTAHAGQSDLGGHTYMGHLMRVAGNFTSDPMQIIAILHDSVEDTPITLSDLRMYFPEYIVNAVDALTRRPDEKYFDYIKRVCGNEYAIFVKIADIRDNMRLDRGAPTKKITDMLPMYQKALGILEIAAMQYDA